MNFVADAEGAGQKEGNQCGAHRRQSFAVERAGEQKAETQILREMQRLVPDPHGELRERRGFRREIENHQHVQQGRQP